MKDNKKIYPYIKDFEITKQKKIIKILSSYTISRNTEKYLIKRVQLKVNEIEISLHTEQVKALFNALYENSEMQILKHEELKTENTYTEPYHIGVIDNGAKVIVGQFIKPNRHQNAELIKILVKAFKWNREIMNGTNIKQIAEREKVSYQYVIRLLNLSFLSPKIVRDILNGNQPTDCTLKKLLSIKTSAWKEQENMLN